jgi:hypothetical protein
MVPIFFVVEVNHLCREQISKFMWEILELPLTWASFLYGKYLKALGLRCLGVIQYLTFHTTPITYQILIILYKESLKKRHSRKYEPGKAVSVAELNYYSVFTSCVLSAVCGERQKIIHGNTHLQTTHLVVTKYCFTWST